MNHHHNYPQQLVTLAISFKLNGWTIVFNNGPLFRKRRHDDQSTVTPWHGWLVGCARNTKTSNVFISVMMGLPPSLAMTKAS